MKRGREVVEGAYPAFYFHNRERGPQGNQGFKSNVLTTSKYTWYNFVPLQLLFQFQKATNVYFLIMTVITFIPQISPIPGWTAAFPFALVLLAGMIKEAIEDYKRHKSDREINNREFNIIEARSGNPRTVTSAELLVGDMVVLECNDNVPADLIVLGTSDQDGLVYIETAQLDGETNLKRHRPFSETEHMAHEELAQLGETRVHCALPTFHLEEFSGAIEVDGKRMPIDESNLILRGTSLRNTEWCIGMVAYAGFDSKLALNSRRPPSKYSTLNKAVDYMVLGIVGVQIVACIIAAGLASSFQSRVGALSSYLMITENPALTGVKAFFSFMILTSYVVPQTLMISLEVAKLIQGRWIELDLDMEGAKARSTDQNDELARVRWICSDKTGTLTANLMTLRHSVVNGIVYDNVLDGSLRRAVEQESMVQEYLYALAVAHTVTIGEDTESDKHRKIKGSKWRFLLRRLGNKFRRKRNRRPVGDDEQLQSHSNPAHGASAVELDEVETGPWAHIVYKGSSPDEEAFVKGTKANGYVFKSRVRDDVTIHRESDASDVVFQVLDTIEFTSTRARMSVVVRHPKGHIVVYSKGADSRMVPLLRSDTDPALLETTMDTLDAHALTGLRTLIVASKHVDEIWYAQWKERLRLIETGEDGGALEERKARQQSVYAEIEKDMDLLGVTSVEDKLQDEVPATIAYFLKAGIRVVMITGDKQGTAINIARSTRLFTSAMSIVPINAANEGEVEATLANAEAQSRSVDQLAIVVDGKTLKWLLKDDLPYQDRFYEILHSAAAIVCCRTNPRQKAKVVALIRDRDKQAITLAIGDGGNDVNMIQKAHIGVGLFGKEGTQAARSSDYALREFKHLKKLVAVHGRWNYLRNATMVQYWVYKNVAFIFVLYWFGIHSAWSGQNYYDAWILTGYNVLFTSLPALFFGFFEKDLSPETIYANPQVYKESQRGVHFTPLTFVMWSLEAFYVSLVLYFVPFLANSDGGAIIDSTYGWISGMNWQGNMACLAGIVVVNLRMLIETRELHIVQHASYWVCFSLLFLALLIESYTTFLTFDQVGMIGELFARPRFWLTWSLSLALALLPALTVKSVLSWFRPSDAQICHEREVLKIH